VVSVEAEINFVLFLIVNKLKRITAKIIRKIYIIFRFLNIVFN
jgi:hypothetical protein